MYDIKFPQFVNTQYIEQCANCPYMNLTADTEWEYTETRKPRSHNMKCMNLEACMRILEVTEYEPEEDEENVWEEYKAN